MIDIPNDIQRELRNWISSSDYIKGYYYNTNSINFISKTVYESHIYFIFKVESERTMDRYKVLIKVNKMAHIIGVGCNCPQFEVSSSCKHIAACLLKHYEEILEDTSPDRIYNLTEELFKQFNNNKVLKKEVFLELNFGYEKDNNRSFYTYLQIKIGNKKMYSLANKIQSFIYDYKNESNELKFGKDFTYNPKEHFLNDENKEIIEILDDSNVEFRHGHLYVNDRIIKKIIKTINNTPLSINEIKINEIKEDFPLAISLNKNDDSYELDFDYSEMAFLTNDREYVFNNNQLYHLDSKKRKFLQSLESLKSKQLVFKEDKINLFSESILPIIKDNLIVDEGTYFEIPSTPSVKLYFDLNMNKIKCNLKFLYKDTLVDYFDKTNRVLRDAVYENEIFNDLELGEKLIIDDPDSIGEFLTERLPELSNKYEVFTTQKIKDINIIKNANVKSNFSIGKDNIMSYNFELGEIKDEELNKIFDSISLKKKYYKLKSGNLIDLNSDSSLDELRKLSTDMELKGTSGTIPKYKAIYIDSLNYDVIKTNNLFDQLIENFKKFKDSNISLTDVDTSILRDYQVTGVKWLYNIDKIDFGGILADEMGLGKSIQAIYYIKELLKENKDYKFLIVSPTSLVYNWENEIKKFGQGMSYKIITGNKKIRNEEIEKSGENVLITSYGLLREDQETYNKIVFKSMIIDEAQNIKNPNTAISKAVKTIKTQTRFALTGTPIENSVIELWSIFDFIMPGFLGSIGKFQKKYKIKEFTQEEEDLLSGLNKLITPFILRRKKFDVVKELPEKIENNVYIDLNDVQKEIYLRELKRVNEELDESLKIDGLEKTKFKILALLTRLRQIVIDPSIVFDNYTGGSNKIDSLLDIVRESVDNGHKILIFTSFKTALNIVKERLEKEKISSYVIDGSVPSKKRMELVDKFNSDDTNVFLIMLKSGGTGLNLTSADVVIHLDLWWNPQVENQATDRAHRIGQDKIVEVIKLITKGTIEEKILELQEKKKILNEKLIESNNRDKSVISSLSENDLRNLLAYENKGDD
ncbi:MAG: DEAD/DEAH box helicase [Bacilli bacterium]